MLNLNSFRNAAYIKIELALEAHWHPSVVRHCIRLCYYLAFVYPFVSGHVDGRNQSYFFNSW